MIALARLWLTGVALALEAAAAIVDRARDVHNRVAGLVERALGERDWG